MTEEQPKQEVVAKKEHKGPVGWLRRDAYINGISEVVAGSKSANEIVSAIALAAHKDKKVAECSQESIYECALDLAQLGLVPDARKLVHLIPYSKKLTVQIDYKGMMEKAYESGAIVSFQADVIHEGDLFDYSCGEVKQHVPHFIRCDANKPAEKGERIGAYAVALFNDGNRQCELMSKEQIENVRDQFANKNSPLWTKSVEEAWKKTVIKRLCKMCPKMPESVRKMAAVDDKPDFKEADARVVNSEDWAAK